MNYILNGKEKDTIVLSADTVRRIVSSANGDAALLYLALSSAGEGERAAIAERLHWDAPRCDSAASALEALGLLRRGEAAPIPAEPQESVRRAEYTRADLARALEGREFASLTAAVENTLGKKLTTPDLALLLGLCDEVGLPTDVIFLLVNFCVERSAAQYGPGRRPTMRQIEREGYAWARLGLMDQDSASAHIRRLARQREVLPRMMKLLRLGERRASPTEEKYLLAWSEMGFDDAMLELAYDKTILKCKELKWPYMHKILLNWKDKGFKTVKDVEDKDRPRAAKPETAPAVSDQEAMEEMQKYLLRMNAESGRREE